MKLVNGCVIVQTVSHELLLQRSGFDPRAVLIGFVVDRMAKGTCINFLLLITILLNTQISSSVTQDMGSRLIRGCSSKRCTVIHSFIHSFISIHRSFLVHNHWIWKLSVDYINILHKICLIVR